MLIEGKTSTGLAISSAVGAVGAGTMAYCTQKSILNGAPVDKFVKTTVSKTDRIFQGIANWMTSVNTDLYSKILKNQKIDWVAIAKSGVKGGLFLGGVYLLYRGIKALCVNTFKQ